MPLAAVLASAMTSSSSANAWDDELGSSGRTRGARLGFNTTSSPPGGTTKTTNIVFSPWREGGPETEIIEPTLMISWSIP
jgi:hypothetical protein